MMAVEIRCATLQDDHIGVLSTYVMHGWLSTRAEAMKEVQPYWSFRDEVVIIDGIAMKVEESKHQHSFRKETWSVMC